MGGTNYSSDNAASATISKEQETQQDSKLSIGLSLYYSIYNEEELDPSQNKTLGDQVKERSNGYMNFHKDAVYEGDPISENVDDMAYRYVDCRKCEFNLDTGEVEDYYMMKKCLDRGLNDVYQLCIDYEDNLHTYDLHINIGGYDLIEDLVGITKYILTGVEPSKGISNKKLKSHAKKNFAGKFQQLKTNGWRFKVTYTCIYSAFETFGDGQEAKKKQAQKEEREHIMFVTLNGQKGAAGYHVNKALRESNGRLSLESVSSACHLLLGLGSLCVFWPPFAFACLAIDLSMHAIECAGAFMDNDKQAAIEHCKGAMLDMVFIIPYGRIGRFMKRGALKAEEKIAAHNVKVAEKGRKEGTSALERVGQNEADVSKYHAEIKEGEAQVKADRENYFKEHPNESEDEVIFSSEFKLSESEANYAKAVERSQKENPQLLAKADKYKADKYNVEVKQNALNEAQVKYTNYAKYSLEVNAKNTVKLETLLEDLKREWNESRFISIRNNAYRLANAGVTGKGVRDSSIALGESFAKYDDRIVVTSEDFTFTDILKESVTSIGEDIGNAVGKIASENKDFKERGGYIGTHGWM